MPTAKNNR